MELIELLEKLTAAFGPSGCEDGVRGVIADLIAPYVDEVRTDAMGSLIAHKKGEGKKLLFSAHMDTIGMIVTHIEKEGSPLWQPWLAACAGYPPSGRGVPERSERHRFSARGQGRG